MSTIHRFVCLVLVATITAGCAAPTSDEPVPCDPPPKQPHKLKFKLKDTGAEKGCVEQVLQDDGTDGTEISVCRGDTVVWKVKLFKKNSVAFDKGDGSPFNWSDSGYEGGKISATVKVGAAAKSYRYSVRTKGGPAGGCPLDPMIIVRD